MGWAAGVLGGIGGIIALDVRDDVIVAMFAAVLLGTVPSLLSVRGLVVQWWGQA